MTKFNNIPNKCVKDIEGNEHWISRSVAVVGAVVIYHQSKAHILIGKRGSGAADYQGLYNLPCGYLDWNESGINACLREICEETGLDIKELNKEFYSGDSEIQCEYSTQPLAVKTHPSNNHENVSLLYLFTIKASSKSHLEFIKTLLHTENSEKDEVDEVRFIDLEEFKNFNFCFNHDKIVERLLNKKINFSDYE